jgi:hypothetical protein
VTSSALSRFQIIDNGAPAAPGHCAVCGTTQGPFIDFGLNLDFYGVVYLCSEVCVVGLANALDYHSPRQWKMALGTIDDLRRENNELRDRVEVLGNVVDSIDRIKSFTYVEPVSEPNFTEELVEKGPDPRQLTLDFPDGEDRVNESAHVEGSTDIFRDDSIDDLLEDLR